PQLRRKGSAGPPAARTNAPETRAIVGQAVCIVRRGFTGHGPLDECAERLLLAQLLEKRGERGAERGDLRRRGAGIRVGGNASRFVVLSLERVRGGGGERARRTRDAARRAPRRAEREHQTQETGDRERSTDPGELGRGRALRMADDEAADDLAA